jgi:hypothetical protein
LAAFFTVFGPIRFIEISRPPWNPDKKGSNLPPGRFACITFHNASDRQAAFAMSHKTDACHRISKWQALPHLKESFPCVWNDLVQWGGRGFKVALASDRELFIPRIDSHEQDSETADKQRQEQPRKLSYQSLAHASDIGDSEVPFEDVGLRRSVQGHPDGVFPAADRTSNGRVQHEAYSGRSVIIWCKEIIIKIAISLDTDLEDITPQPSLSKQRAMTWRLFSGTMIRSKK